MKISVRNLGVIRQAEFTLGDLTIICGGNNTGKTYVTHSTYGFLDYLRSNVNFPVEGGVVDRLFQEGSVSIPLSPYIENLQTYLDAAAKEYSEIMFRVFAGSESRFTESDFQKYTAAEGRRSLCPATK